MTAQRWKLVIFGDGSLRWRKAAKRLAREARESPQPLEIDVLDRKSLASRYPNFVNRHRLILDNAPRGFGYWIWKPFLIREALREGSSGGVIYMDAGSTLNFANEASRQRWIDYQDEANLSDALFFQMDHEEAKYTKPELLSRFSAPQEIRLSGQLEATHMIARAGHSSEHFFDEWYGHCGESGYRFLDDSRWEPSGPEFVAHRHDQSILSCLVKQTGFGTVLPQETYFAPEWMEAGAGFPIWGTRLKSGRSFFKPQRTIRGHHIGTPPEFAVDLANAVKRRTVQHGLEAVTDPNYPPWRD